jgi:hypothetical protein
MQGLGARLCPMMQQTEVCERKLGTRGTCFGAFSMVCIHKRRRNAWTVLWGARVAIRYCWEMAVDIQANTVPTARARFIALYDMVSDDTDHCRGAIASDVYGTRALFAG